MERYRRVPGEGRYARPEPEHRYVLPGVPAGATDAVEITDRYLVGVRLRLRTMQAGDIVVHKLTQKVRRDADDPLTVMTTTVYLEPTERERLAALPAATLRKRRWSLPTCDLVVDQMLGHLDGLVLAERPVGQGRGAPPAGSVEVSADERFTGGSLARLDRFAARALVHLVQGWR